MRDPTLAAVLSAIVPGVGQLYNGRTLAGILCLIITPGYWIGTGGLLGWVCHPIAPVLFDRHSPSDIRVSENFASETV
jgi:TM2 domain-containing membrane protein YozV